MATRVMSVPAIRRWTLTPQILLSLLGGGAVIALVLAVAHPPEPVVAGAALLSHLSGMLAGYGVAVMLVLMARTPMIEHGVGAGRLARWHSRAGPVIIALAAVHAVAAVLAWADVRGIGSLAAAREVLGWPGLLAATLGLALLLAVGFVSLRWVRRRLAY